MRKWVHLLLILSWVIGFNGCYSRVASDSLGQKNSTLIPKLGKSTESDLLFSNLPQLELDITVPESSIEAIQQPDRPYVRAKFLHVGTEHPVTVGVKLKGAAGSFRDFHDRPALTINMDKFSKKQRFFGLDKFHLNNSVQDDTFMHELLGAQLFASAGYPAPRITHALLRLNGQARHLYVLKEGVDATFLSRHFQDAKGNLYDGGFLQDLHAPLEKDEGNGVDDHSDLQRIVAAIERPPQERWNVLDTMVDLDRFLTFMAIESMMAHWDGYSAKANNYRLYMDPTSHKAIFLPHGMDQIFGELGMPLFDHSDSLLGAAVLQSDLMRSKYRKRVSELLPLFEPSNLERSIDERLSSIQGLLNQSDGFDPNAYRDRIVDLKNRIRERYENVVHQLESPDEATFVWNDNVTKLKDWYPWEEDPSLQLVSSNTEGSTTLKIQNSGTVRRESSWHHQLLLGPGKYRLTGELIAGELKRAPIDEDLQHTAEASLFITPFGGNERVSRDETKQVQLDFEVLEDRRRIEFVFEMRGAGVVELADPELTKLAE